MDNTKSPASEFKNSRTLRQASLSKKRNMAQKVVVRVKLGEGDGRKRKSEGPPSDSWSWRKYGQKPIKGSPHPRTRLKDNEEDSFHYSQSPFNTSQDIIINNYLFTQTLGTSSSLLLDGEEPLSYPHLMDFNSPPPNHKKENYDFYDELEELPHTSSFITHSTLSSRTQSL
nr:probable WRKY transcription factor 65 isoform X2 [Ipomoea batatas]GMD66699.1 probable WRKY transcription factor 65 isoform X2 [Ipomoea batatas]